MAAKNLTLEEEKTSLENYFCSTELVEQVNGHLISLSVFHILLSITAVLGNALILTALYRESSLHPPSKLLYCNLAITDLCVGFSADPLEVVRCTAHMNKQWNICRKVFHYNIIISYILCSVSLLTVTAVSVDRLLALLLGLRYRQVVTSKRMYAVIAILWAISIITATMYYLNPQITFWSGNIGISLCLVTSIIAYTKIFLTLRHSRFKVQGHLSQGQPSRAIPLNIERYRKAVYSALWVQLTLVLCYLPYGIAVALTPEKGLPSSVYLAREYTPTFVYLNSSLNPLLYCWKIREVRQAVKETLRQNCCSTS